MREAEIAKRSEKYVERKPIKQSVLNMGYVILALLLVFTILTKNSFFLFLFLTVFSTIVDYQTNMVAIRFNPQPEVFSSLMIAKFIGFPAALIMLLIPTLFVDIYTARLDKDTFISTLLTVIICYLMASFNFFSFTIFAVILVTIKFIANLALNLLLDISLPEILFEHVLGFIVNIIFFLAFGNFFYLLFYKV